MRSVSGVQNATSAPAERVIPLKHIARVNVATLDDMTDPDYAFDYVDISSVTPEEGIARRERVTFGTAPSRARRKVAHGDTIASTVRTYLRAVAFVDEPDDLVVSTGFAVLSPCPGVDPRYLYRAVQSKPFVDEVVAQSTGVSYPAINPSDLGRIGVCLPDLGAQRAIADFLDRETEKIDPLVAKKQRLIELLQEKRTALISHAVTRGLDSDVPMKNSGIEWLGAVPRGWRAIPLKHCTSVTVGIVVTPAKYYVDDGVPCLRSLNVREEGLDEADLVFISEKSNLLLAKSMLRAGDVVVVRTGQPGTAAVIDDAFDGANCIDLIVIRRSQAFDSHYLASLLNSPALRGQFARSSDGAIQQHFNVQTAMNLSLPCPPVHEQRAIVAWASRESGQIRGLMDKVATATARLREYRSALITAAVTGQIDVGAR